MRDTADWYRGFAKADAHGRSAVYEDWALGIAGDAEMVAMIDELPETRRQPSLVFSVSRLLGAEPTGFAAFRSWLVDNWPRVRPEVEARLNQTNEPGRCAAILPAIAQIPGPLALLEVGASAGLCLYPDRYSYRYTNSDGDGATIHPSDGESTVLLECAIAGPVPIPGRMPEVVWRAGIDLDPIDLNTADGREWLEVMAWPEENARRHRIRSAIEIARSDPPHLVAGDATDALLELAATAPTDATLVLVTSGVLVYLPYLERLRFIELAGRLDARWVSLEGVAVIPSVQERVQHSERSTPGRFVLALDEHPLAFAGPHGQSLDWFGPSDGRGGESGRSATGQTAFRFIQ
jgi:hypothetical protein